MTTKHTPGPWHVFAPLENGSQHSIGKWLDDKDERYWLAAIYPVREVPHKFKSQHCDEAEANAHLIAASPTLLEFAQREARNGNNEAKLMLASLQLCE